MALVLAVLATGCEQVIGIKQATVVDAAPPIQEPGPSDASSDAPIDMAPAPPACVPADCPFGCDTVANACKTGKLVIFKTASAYLGNGFGGGDTPPNVRGGADSECGVNFTALYPALQCNRMHAILHISTTDSVGKMPANYGIPTDAQIRRADDDELVSNNWIDLTDPTKALRTSASTVTSDADGAIWTGTNTTSTCSNWTSGAMAVTGTRGFANRSEASWLTEDAFRCDRSQHLLCICWQAGSP